MKIILNGICGTQQNVGVDPNKYAIDAHMVYKYTNAMNYIEELEKYINTCGESEGRLPETTEKFNMYKYQFNNPFINGKPYHILGELDDNQKL